MLGMMGSERGICINGGACSITSVGYFLLLFGAKLLFSRCGFRKGRMGLILMRVDGCEVGAGGDEKEKENERVFSPFNGRGFGSIRVDG